MVRGVPERERKALAEGQRRVILIKKGLKGGWGVKSHMDIP